jgi:hypothetical protein
MGFLAFGHVLHDGLKAKCSRAQLIVPFAHRIELRYTMSASIHTQSDNSWAVTHGYSNAPSSSLCGPWKAGVDAGPVLTGGALTAQAPLHPTYVT